MNDFFKWCSQYRKPIGYTIGGLNVLAGVNQLANSEYAFAVLSFAIAIFLIVDSWIYEEDKT